MEERRRLLFHAFAMLTVAFLLGFVAAAAGNEKHPHARLWMGAHTTGILIGVFMLALGLARPYLALGARAGWTFFVCTTWGNWIGMAILGVFAASMGAGTPIVAPGLPRPTGWVAALIGSALIVTSSTTFAVCFLGLYGLRRSAAVRHADASSPSRAVALTT